MPGFEMAGETPGAMGVTRVGGAFSTQVWLVVRLPVVHPVVGGPGPPGREAVTTSYTSVRPSSIAWLVGGLLVSVSTVS